MSITRQLKGTGVALVTPFHKDGSIDFKSFEKLINHLINGKVEYLVPLGTTGESVTLSKDEKIAVLDFVTEVNNKRVPVVLGLGGNNTNEVLSQMNQYDFSHVDAILSISPYYNKPSQRGIYQHYKMIGNNSPVPVILYNVPSRTGSNMTAETSLNLAHDIKNIIGMKEASGNLEQCLSIIKNKPKDFLLISGDDGITLPLIACGADGVISVIANAYPKGFSEMVRQSLAGNFSKARDLNFIYSDLVPLLFTEGSPSGIKALLSMLGVTQEFVRLPMVGVSKGLQNKLADLMKGIK